MSVTNPLQTQDSTGHHPQEPAKKRLRSPGRHLLSVLVEDYFQVGAFQKWIDPSRWSRLESRLEANVDRTLEFLQQHQTRATFFVLGWNARRFPQVIRRIADQGHELASGGMLHRALETFTPQSFREDLRESRHWIEQAGQQPVLGYRLAEGWIGPQDLWILDALSEEGFAYDSSLMFRGWSWQHDRRIRQAHRHVTPTGHLWEFPPTTFRLPGFDLPIAGGNYFRQLPRHLVRLLMSRQSRSQQTPLMLYFHVWELDVAQPTVTAAGRVNKVRHYRNLAKMTKVLPYFLGRYQFGTVRDYLVEVDADVWELCEAQRLQQMSLPTWSNEAEAHETDPIGIPGTIWSLADAPPPVTAENEVARSRQASQRREQRARWSQSDGHLTPVTIVIPCFNEAQTLPYLCGTIDDVENALGTKYDVEFVFVDDGSSDDTWSLLNTHFGSRPRCRLIKHEVNQGITAAVLTGMKAARTEIVCSIDCDCSYDPLELKQMIPLLTKGVDLVTASPYHPAGGVRNVPGWRLSLSGGASWLYRRVLGSSLYTFTSCFRVYRRSSVVDLPIEHHGFLGMAETLGQVLLRGGQVVEYPAVLSVRLFGASKMKTLRTIAGHLGLMARLLRFRMLGQRTPATIAQSPNDANTASRSTVLDVSEQIAV